jgi:hypothetical protein
MRTSLLAVWLILMSGCAAFEQTPEDVQKKLTDPTKGQLYERDPMQGY